MMEVKTNKEKQQQQQTEPHTSIFRITFLLVFIHTKKEEIY